MTKTTAITKSNLPADLPILSGIGTVKDLINQRKDFVRWVHSTFHDISLRALALEEGAFFFAYEQYERRIVEMRRKIEELHNYQEKVMDKHQLRRARQAVEVEQLRTALAEMKPRRAQSLREAKKILIHLEIEKERLEIRKEREQYEFSRIRARQEERRYIQQTLASQVAEHSVIRAEFIERAKKIISDPELLEQTIEEYDRTLHELGGD